MKYFEQQSKQMMENQQKMHNQFMKNANLNDEERRKFEQNNQLLMENQKKLNAMFKQNFGNYQ